MFNSQVIVSKSLFRIQKDFNCKERDNYVTKMKYCAYEIMHRSFKQVM